MTSKHVTPDHGLADAFDIVAADTTHDATAHALTSAAEMLRRSLISRAADLSAMAQAAGAAATALHLAALASAVSNNDLRESLTADAARIIELLSLDLSGDTREAAEVSPQ